LTGGVNSAAFPWPHGARVAGLLIGNDLKQGLRKHLAGPGWRGRMLQAGGLVFGLGFFAALHLGAWAVLVYTKQTPARDPGMLLAGVSAALWGFLLFVMISGGLMRALVVLHEQDDSALLLGSPASPRAVLAARLFGNALQSCLVDGFIIVPWIDTRVFWFGEWNCLWGFPVWFAAAVMVTCIDGLFSFGLIRWCGLRRARLFSQVIPFALIFGVTFFAGTASVSLAQMNVGAAHAHMPPALQAQLTALAPTPLFAVALAAEGNAPDLLLLFAGMVALAWLTLRLTERAFVEGSQNVVENVNPAGAARADGPFRAGLFALEVRKDLRLVMRTPMIAVQCIAQVLTPVGIAFVLGREDIARAVAFFTIFAAGVLGGIVTIAAGTVEECDDLLVMAPRPYRRFRFGKIVAGCLVPGLFLLLVGAGLLLAGRPLEAGAVLFGGIPLTVTGAIAGETFATPVKVGHRPRLLADPIMMIPLLGLQIVSGLVAGTTVFAAAFSGLLLVAALLASYILLAIAFGLAQLKKPLFA
jgi:ABC-2 type transport system permease protein